MLDLNFVRENLPLVEEKLRQRGMDPAAVLKDFRNVDAERRKAITEAETLKARRNDLQRRFITLIQEFQQLKAEEKQLIAEKCDLKANDEARAKNRDEQQEIKAIQTELKRSVPAADKLVDDLDARLSDILPGLPNLPQASVPVGRSADDNVEVRRWGTPPKLDFTPKPHWDLGPELGVLDFERAVKLTGARFVVYWDLGAKLERALANFMLDLHTREHGYTEVLPPYLVNSDSMYGTGQLPKFAADSFHVPTGIWGADPGHPPVPGETVFVKGWDHAGTVVSVNDALRTAEVFEQALLNTGPVKTVPWTEMSYERNFWLIPTAEVPVTNLFRDEVLEQARLPISLTAYTPCFRSEAGSYGKDVRGIIRQHQFQKVELVKFAHPEHSYEEHEKLTHDAEEVLQKLGLHYRVVTLSTGDMSAASACSNFESYQARRANIRYRPEGKNKTEFVHTLNGSGLAVGRTWVAIVENYQQSDGSVVIPEALRPYIGAERITARKM
jgi:seryl-tRNA synthetase